MFKKHKCMQSQIKVSSFKSSFFYKIKGHLSAQFLQCLGDFWNDWAQEIQL